MMNFVTELSHTSKGFNLIWVIVGRMTKSAHFLPIKTTYNISQFRQLYIDEIVRLHGVLISSISHHGPIHVLLLEAFQGALGTQLDFSTAFHLQTEEQFERTI